MAYLSAHGTMKPPLGAQLDPAHPFTQDLRLAILFNENYGVSATGTKGVPAILTAGPRTTPYALSVNGTGTWTSNAQGIAFGLATTNFLTLNGGGTAALDPVPTAAITVLLIRRKTDTTLRNAAIFGSSPTVEAETCGTWAPYTDSKMYWDFGGKTSAPNRLISAALSWDTTVDRFVFTAGPAGSAIWRNGVKVASQSTAITRTASANAFYLNSGHFAGNNGDSIEVNFFQVNGTQWSDALCQEWSAEPYAHLYPRPMTFVGSSKGKGKIPTAVIGATAASSAASGGTGPLLTTVGVG